MRAVCGLAALVIFNAGILEGGAVSQPPPPSTALLGGRVGSLTGIICVDWYYMESVWVANWEMHLSRNLVHISPTFPLPLFIPA